MSDRLLKLSQASAACPKCRSEGYIVSPGRNQAVARRCPSCQSTCPKCGGTGLLYYRDATGAAVSYKCTCQTLSQRLELYNRAEVPRHYATAKIETLEALDPSQGKAKLALERLLNVFKPGTVGLGLAGKVGTGKTHLMAGLVRELTLDAGIPARFVEFSHLLGEIKAGYSAGKGEAEILGDLIDVPVLVIDELGKGLETEWQRSILDELISKRYNRQVSTFFTTNFPFRLRADRAAAGDAMRVTTLKDRIGPRMYSRLAEMTRFVAIQGPDYREMRALGER